jgi:hypothetical protein
MPLRQVSRPSRMHSDSGSDIPLYNYEQSFTATRGDPNTCPAALLGFSPKAGLQQTTPNRTPTYRSLAWLD